MYQIDLVILDLNLPDEQMNGFTMINTLRKAKVRIPIIIISGNSEIQEKIKALDTGADDYLVKPFDGKELLARVKRHIFRSSNHYSNKFIVGELELDTDTQLVIVNKVGAAAGETVEYTLKLTKKEYDLLALLMSKPGATVSKNTILKNLYRDKSDEPDSKITDVLVCKIRKEIAKYTKRQYIHTFWSRGYSVKDVANSSRDTFITTIDTKHGDHINIEGLTNAIDSNSYNLSQMTQNKDHLLNNKDGNRNQTNNADYNQTNKNKKNTVNIQPRKLFA
jgi:two-component system cell cycle response regulator CtrA